MVVLLLALSFALIIGGAMLFTNAVEWAGPRLGLGEGAVGSVIAAVATALPESTIPAVALIGGANAEDTEIAIGSIIGAPFLLGTLAMALVGLSARLFRERREQDERIEVQVHAARRDLRVFTAAFAVGLALGVLEVGAPVRVAAAVALVVGYLAYATWTVKHPGETADEEPGPLLFDTTKQDPPSDVQLIGQVVVAVVAIVGGAELFVEEVKQIAESLGVPLIVLALVLAPLATELPEKANSVLWVRSGKDTLALGNITGAMTFQAAIPVAIGLAFTDWALSSEALAAGVLGILGGLLAYWQLEAPTFGRVSIAAWLAAYLGFVGATLVTG